MRASGARAQMRAARYSTDHYTALSSGVSFHNDFAISPILPADAAVAYIRQPRRPPRAAPACAAPRAAMLTFSARMLR